MANLLQSATLVENFSGSGRPSVEVFLRSVERAAVLGNWTVPQKLGLAKLKLRGGAAEYLESDPALENADNWDTFRALLLVRYQEITTLANATNQMATCMQKNSESVQDYATRLRLLGLKTLRVVADEEENRIRRDMLDEQLNAQFQRGLRDSIRRFVQSREPENFTDAVRQATREEQCESSLRPRRVLAVSAPETPQPEPHRQENRPGRPQGQLGVANSNNYAYQSPQ